MNDFTWKGMFKDSLKSEDDVALFVEPTEAPENFYCDGEIKANIAMPRWLSKMKKAGFSADTIKKAIKYNFGYSLTKKAMSDKEIYDYLENNEQVTAQMLKHGVVSGKILTKKIMKSKAMKLYEQATDALRKEITEKLAKLFKDNKATTITFGEAVFTHFITDNNYVDIKGVR